MENLEPRILDEFPKHHQLLERAVIHLQGDDRVVALVLGGSIAKSAMDFYSDIDLYIITEDEFFDTLFAERHALADHTGTAWFRFIADHNPGGEHDYIVLYPGPVKIDFMYCRASDVAPAPKWTHCLILKDHEAFMAGIRSRSQDLVPPQPEPEMILALNQKFWTWCWYVFGKIVRGEHWMALAGIHAVRSMAILPMLAWAKGLPQEGYRRLERKVTAGEQPLLAATICGLQPAALSAALEAEMVLFGKLRERVFRRFDLSYEPGPEQKLQQEMRRRASAWS
jgi:predicted nucleotidyltransferase